MTNPLNKLQEQPYEVRIKILWGVVVVVAVLLTVLIINSINSTIGNAGENLMKIQSSKTLPDSPFAYGTVERIEQTDNSLNIYFNMNNPGDDILNMSNLSQVSITSGNKTYKPQKITDRQGNSFVQKILSHTQNFGILVFPAVKGARATLLFDQMFLEKSPVDMFQQKIDMDLIQLNKAAQVRN